MNLWKYHYCLSTWEKPLWTASSSWGTLLVLNVFGVYCFYNQPHVHRHLKSCNTLFTVFQYYHWFSCSFVLLETNNTRNESKHHTIFNSYLLAFTPMKNVGSCNKNCQLVNSVNHRIFERRLPSLDIQEASLSERRVKPAYSGVAREL